MHHGRQRGLAALGLLVLLAACSGEPKAPEQPALTLPSGTATTAVPAAVAGDWTTYHRDNARSGYLAGLPDPTRLDPAWHARLRPGHRPGLRGRRGHRPGPRAGRGGGARRAGPGAPLGRPARHAPGAAPAAGGAGPVRR